MADMSQPELREYQALVARAIQIAKAYLRVVRLRQRIGTVRGAGTHALYREHASAVAALRTEVDALGPDGLDKLSK